jgi:phenol hydroxylase P0 protein
VQIVKLQRNMGQMRRRAGAAMPVKAARYLGVYPKIIEISALGTAGWHRPCIDQGMSTTPTPSADPRTGWDVQRRFIRIVQEHDSGMVEFEFAVGEPQLYVEMVMPRREFGEFCAMQGVQPTHGALPEHDAGSDAHEWDWSLRAARERHFRHEP